MSNETETLEETATKETKAQSTTKRQPQKVQVRPVADVYRDKEAVKVLLDLPGASEDQIQVSVHDGELTIQAEVPRGEEEVRVYSRSFQVDRRLDTAQIEAQLRHGVLRLQIPFLEELKPRKIEVLAG